MKRNVLSINVDLKQQGLGGDDTWSKRAQAHAAYLIKPGTYNYSFYLVPFTSKIKIENIKF
jgi:beta-galactosidase